MRRAAGAAEMANSLLRYRLTLDYMGASTDDTVEVFADGTVWRWSLHPARADRKDEAGTFRLELADAELNELRELAEELPELAPGTPATHGHVQRTIEVADQLINLPDASTDQSSRLSRARQALDALAERALAGPVAVVRLSARLTPTLSPGVTSPTFVLHGIGSRPVRLMLTYDEISLLAIQREGNRKVFRGREELSSGLIEPMGEMLDGFVRPAELAPGSSAALLFNEGLSGLDPGERLLATIRGRIALEGPAAKDDYPSASFRISAEL